MLTAANEAPREAGASARCVYAFTLLCLASFALTLVLSSLLIHPFSFSLTLAGALALEGIDIGALIFWAPKAGHLVLVWRDALLVLDPLTSRPHPRAPLCDILFQLIDPGLLLNP